MIANKIKVFVFSFLLFSFNVCSQVNIVQGPFKLKGADDSSIRYVKNQDESISFVVKNKSLDSIVENYEVGDGVPKNETVFFTKLSGERTVVSLVSWDESNINEVHYKIFVYAYDRYGVIKRNERINADKHLEGYEGYNGQGSTFGLKNANLIRAYLDSNYNK